MEGEYFDPRKNLITFTKETRGAEAICSWREALDRISRAQNKLWLRTPIRERQALLAEVDRESEKTKK